MLGLKPALVFGALCMAGFLCCVPMAMPQGHLVAFCGDMGIAPSEGAAMLSVLLGCAFVSRQFWGFLADRIGGPRTILAGSACQITAMIGFLLTRNEAGLFAVAAWFGLGFSGIIPAYVLAVRELISGQRGVVAGAEQSCCSPVQEWRLGAGLLARFTTPSAFTLRRSPLASCSISRT